MPDDFEAKLAKTMEEAKGKRKEEIATVEFVQGSVKYNVRKISGFLRPPKLRLLPLLSLTTCLLLSPIPPSVRTSYVNVSADRLDQHVPRSGDVQEGGGRAYPRHGGPQGRQESRPRPVPLHGKHDELDELPEALEHSFGSSRGETCQSRKQPTQREYESFSI